MDNFPEYSPTRHGCDVLAVTAVPAMLDCVVADLGVVRARLGDGLRVLRLPEMARLPPMKRQYFAHPPKSA